MIQPTTLLNPIIAPSAPSPVTPGEGAAFDLALATVGEVAASVRWIAATGKALPVVVALGATTGVMPATIDLADVANPVRPPLQAGPLSQQPSVTEGMRQPSTDLPDASSAWDEIAPSAEHPASLSLAVAPSSFATLAAAVAATPRGAAPPARTILMDTAQPTPTIPPATPDALGQDATDPRSAEAPERRSADVSPANTLPLIVASPAPSVPDTPVAKALTVAVAQPAAIPGAIDAGPDRTDPATAPVSATRVFTAPTPVRADDSPAVARGPTPPEIDLSPDPRPSPAKEHPATALSPNSASTPASITTEPLGPVAPMVATLGSVPQPTCTAMANADAESADGNRPANSALPPDAVPPRSTVARPTRSDDASAVDLSRQPVELIDDTPSESAVEDDGAPTPQSPDFVLSPTGPEQAETVSALPASPVAPMPLVAPAAVPQIASPDAPVGLTPPTSARQAVPIEPSTSAPSGPAPTPRMPAAKSLPPIARPPSPATARRQSERATSITSAPFNPAPTTAGAVGEFTPAPRSSARQMTASTATATAPDVVAVTASALPNAPDMASPAGRAGSTRPVDPALPPRRTGASAPIVAASAPSLTPVPPLTTSRVPAQLASEPHAVPVGAPVIPARPDAPDMTAAATEPPHTSETTAPTRATDVTRLPPTAPVAPLIVAGATAPAFRLFAAAIHAARAEENDRIGPPATVAAIEQPRAAFAGAGAERAPLDMTDRGWPHTMVERIERLQDSVGAARDAVSTSIRLVPDALGAIDVGVRRDGDTLHVHFSAEQAQTRTLLAEAQPRLQEIAEAKGIKLAQANVGAGADGQAQRQPAPRTPTRSAPAPAVRDDQREPATTTRVA